MKLDLPLEVLILLAGVVAGVGFIMPVDSMRSRLRILFVILGLWAMVGLVAYASYRVL